jgi:hypothetical protein
MELHGSPRVPIKIPVFAYGYTAVIRLNCERHHAVASDQLRIQPWAGSWFSAKADKIFFSLRTPNVPPYRQRQRASLLERAVNEETRNLIQGID